MASLTLKNIPEDLHQSLKTQAAEHGRSLNSEAIVALRIHVSQRPLDVDAFLARARKLRRGISVRVDENTIRRFKNEGRM